MSSLSAVTDVNDGDDRRIPTIDRLARGALIASLAGIESGGLTLEDSLGAHRFGAGGDSDAQSGDLSATVAVRSPRFYRRAAFGGSLAAAESYLDGEWSCDNLTSLFRIVLQNPQAFQAMDRGIVAKLASAIDRMAHWLRRNTQRGSRKNIGAHYDLGNEL